MTLDNNDKKFIKNAIDEAVNKATKNGSKKSSVSDRYSERLKELNRNQRLVELSKKYHSSRESLAERIELEKLMLDKKLSSKIPMGVRQSLGDSSQKIHSGMNDIAESNSMKSLKKALLYSNPITALIADNMDLVKGAGKISGGLLGGAIKGSSELIYSLLRGKRPHKVNKNIRTGTSLIPSLSQGTKAITDNLYNVQKLTTIKGNNYIAAKQAIFLGGKNYINVLQSSKQSVPMLPSYKNKLSGMFSSTNQLNQTENSHPLMIGQQKDDNIIKMVKGIDGVYRASQVTNKILLALKSKQALIVGGLTLGVLGILGLVAWLKGLFRGAKERRENQQNAILNSPSSVANQETLTDIFEKSDLGKITEYSESSKITALPNSIQQEMPKDNPHFKPLKTVQFNTSTDKVEGDALNQKVVLVPAPYDGYFVKNIFEKNNTFTMSFVRTDTKPTSPFYISNIVRPTLWAYGVKFKKGFPIGYAEKGKFNIHTNDESGIFASEYQEMVNSMTSEDYAEHVKNMPKSDYTKNVKASDKKYKEISKLTPTEHAFKFGEAKFKENIERNNDEVGTNISLDTTPKNSYNNTNKNVENAKQLNINNKNDTKLVNNIQSSSQPSSITINQATPASPLIAGFTNTSDLIIAFDDGLALS